MRNQHFTTMVIGILLMSFAQSVSAQNDNSTLVLFEFGKRDSNENCNTFNGPIESEEDIIYARDLLQSNTQQISEYPLVLNVRPDKEVLRNADIVGSSNKDLWKLSSVYFLRGDYSYIQLVVTCVNDIDNILLNLNREGWGIQPEYLVVIAPEQFTIIKEISHLVQIDIAGYESGVIKFTWKPVIGYDYYLQYNSNLTTKDWKQVEEVSAPLLDNYVEVPVNEDNYKFYRIISVRSN